jgi:hypothetical protein
LALLLLGGEGRSGRPSGLFDNAPACIRRCLQQYAHGFDLVALKCFPLQFEPKQVSEREWRTRMKLEKFAKNRKQSFEKLKKYYGSVGFTLLQGTDFMVFYSG